MANVGTLSVTLIANLKKFVAGMKLAAGRTKDFANKVGRSMRSAGAAVKRFALNAARSLKTFITKWVRRAIIAFGALAIASIKWAADAEESENLVRESFEGMTGAVIKWSERLQKELGLDAIQLRKQAGFFNLLTLSMGATEKQAFNVSTSLTELAADLASFRNQNFENIFNAMRSGMVGMTRPLQNLGINIKENAVDQLLFRLQIDRTAESLTEQERVLARYIAILEATDKDTGDLAHTYDSFTNVMRVMATNAKILSREMGDTLKNAITPLAIRMRDWLINNREDVALWHKEVVEKFIDFTSFFTSSTWRDGLEKGLALSVMIFRAFGRVVTAMMKDVFVNIGRDMMGWIRNAAFREGAVMREMDEQFKKMGVSFSERLAGVATGGKFGIDPALVKTIRERAKAVVKAREEAGEFDDFLGIERSTIAVKTLKEELKGLAAEITRITAEGAKERDRLDAEFAKGQAERDARNAKLRAESKARREKALAEATAEFIALTEANRAAAEAAGVSWANTAETIKQVMVAANDEVKNAFADMLVSMATEMDNFGDFAEEFIVNLTKAIARMQAELIAARILGTTEGGAGGAGFLQQFLGFLGGALGGRGSGGAQAKARGGIVKPVFAAKGFAPRGSDTVPAMLTPGEGVLSKGLTEMLREQLAVPGGMGGPTPVTIQIQTIDTQNTAQWLNNNKRLIAGMLNETRQGNNPASRRFSRRR